MKAIRHRFHNEQGLQLAANVDFPDQHQPKAFILYAHCFTCSKNLKSIVNIAKTCTEYGYAVFRFDFTGLSESQGEFEETMLSTNVGDIRSAVAYMKDNLEAPQLMIGHSMGGVAVLLAATNSPDCRAVVTVATPSDASHLGTVLQSVRDKALREGSADVTIGGKPYRLGRRFFEELEEHNVKQALGRLDKALLILHSPVDQTVSIDHAANLFKFASHPKSFISLDTADHILTREQDARYVGTLISAWMSRYIQPNP